MKYRPRKYVAPPEGSLWSDQAARYLGIALTTLYKWRQNGYGPVPYPVGRKLAYELTVLDAWLHGQGRTNCKPVASAA
ncbi:helix-turn-helix transcriptional regulator [Streptomyces sp. NPDC059385]|uniref:helix-turn-helix transcriptional regulator n=1 Tax=Streptomyces sp. NPDC059385 TaxID=3346817 RepID=UPI0036B87345